MTREQAKQKLISFGVEEPTDEQVSELLNSINAETKKEKDRAENYKTKADKADELQSRVNELEAGNLSENEKLTKALETANKTIADMQRSNAIRDLREQAMTDFKITAEQAKSIVKDDGSFDTAVLGQIIVQKETNAATAKEQEIANNATNPGGGNNTTTEKNDKPEDVKNAESITFGNVAVEQSAKDYYKI